MTQRLRIWVRYKFDGITDGGITVYVYISEVLWQTFDLVLNLSSQSAYSALSRLERQV